MIKVLRILTPDTLSPCTREIEGVEIPRGSTIRDLLPMDWSSEPGQTLIFLGATRCSDWDRELEEGDIVHLIGGVAEPSTMIMVALAIVSAILQYSLSTKGLHKQDPEKNPGGSSAYSYFGFANSYRAEGDPIPIVYGRMRVAPPVVNQVIATNSISPQLSLAVREDMFVLLAISEGPIYGIGRYVGEVETDADQTTIVGSALIAAAVPGSGLQINGIAAENYISSIAWRTGTLNQQALIGSQGYVDYTDVSVSYVLDLTPLNGNADVTEATYPSGSFADGSASLLSNEDPTQYAEQKITQQVDKALVQIFFERGLWEQNSQGGFNGVSKTIRIQYRRTDSSGVGIGDWVLLPAYTVASSQNTPLALDIPIDFVSPDTFAPPVNHGYYEGDSFYSHYLKNDGAGLTHQDSWKPSNSGQYTQQWTMGGWIHERLPPPPTVPEVGTQAILFYMDNGTGPLPPSWSVGQPPDMTWDGGPHPAQVTTAMAGMVCRLWRDADEAYCIVEMWDGSYSQNTYARWKAFLGSTITDIPGFTLEFQHISIIYDGTAPGGPKMTAILNGIFSFDMTRAEVHSAGGSISHGAEDVFPQWPTGRWRWGSWANNTDWSNWRQSRANHCEFYLYDGVLDAGTLGLLGNPNPSLDFFGLNTSTIQQVLGSDPKTLMLISMGDDETDSGNFYYRERVTNPDGQALIPAQSAQLTGGNSAHQATGAPVWTTILGTPQKDYFVVQVFVDEQESTTSYNDVATISTITAFSSQPYRYPITAIASVKVEANEQINNQQPAITLLVKGRLVDTWDGALDAFGNPQLVQKWSRNPAWIAADLIKSERYGLGSELTPDSIDWSSFYTWAEFCDEGVPDAFGDVEIFGLAAEGDTVVSTRQLLTIYVGLVSSGGSTTSSVPQSWQLPEVGTGDPEAFVSIRSVAAGGIVEGWITANDIVTGLNAASNRLPIYSITYHEDSSGFHGFESWAEVKLDWQRLDEIGDPIWPIGAATGDAYYADDLGLSDGVLATTSGYEARCMFDGIFDQVEQGAWDAVLQIFAAGRAMPIKAGRKIYAVIDRPRPVVAIFGQGNIIDDSLELLYTGPKQSPNSIEGDILDEDHNYEKRTIQVDHSSIQDPTSGEAYRKERVQFRGIVRTSQAMRDATYRLNRYYLTRREVKFDVGPDAVNLMPGDRIRVSHDVPQYGFSGRLRADGVRTQLYPNAGDLTAAWSKNGGPNALTVGALLTYDAGTSAPISSNYDPTLFQSLPTTADASGPAASQYFDGSDDDSSKLPPWASQVVAHSDTLYPPNPIVDPLVQIDAADFELAFSAYIKEPARGAATYVTLNIYRFVDADGALVQNSRFCEWTWTSGAPVQSAASTGITGSVTSIGGGWYRIGAVYDNSVVGGAVGEYLQARLYMNTGAHNVGVFSSIADGGKGVNLLHHGDPLDCMASEWTRMNHGTGSITVINSTVADPFYQKTDGSYGYVAKFYKPGGVGSGTTPPGLIQTWLTTTGSGISSWNGEIVTLSGYARVGSGNAASNTLMYVDIRVSSSTDAQGNLDGDGVRATFTTDAGSGSWSASGTPAKIEVSGTVNWVWHAVSHVRLDSTSTDPDWVEWEVQMSYTPTSGNVARFAVSVYTDSTHAADRELDVWGLRFHGESSTGQNVSRYYHKQLLVHGAMVEEAGTINAFALGGAIKLDRDVTLTSGKNYEVLLRSSFEPDSGINADSSEVVTVDASEVPTSGSVIKTANTDLLVSYPRLFSPHEGDIYSFGESGKAAEDFVIERISLDPATMQRTINAIEYNEAIYDDTDFGTTGTETISALPPPLSQGIAASYGGMGIPFQGTTPRSNFTLDVRDESESDETGSFQPRIAVRWNWPRGIRTPRSVNIYFQEELPLARRREGRTAPIFVANVQGSNRSFTFIHSTLKRNQSYRIYCQPVGSSGSAMPLLSSPSQVLTLTKVPLPSMLPAPVVTTATRGWQQLYELKRIATSRTAEVVEGRIGGWKLGMPAFVIDPDTSNTASDSTLVGQSQTSTGRVQTEVFCRSRSSLGTYGVASITQGSEQLKDVLYDDSVDASNDYGNLGSMSTEMEVDDGDLKFKDSSSVLAATYLPDPILLSSPQRLLVNVVPHAVQVRPETLADLEYALGSGTLRRWSLEGPMDDFDDDDAEIVVDWRWSSTASTTGETWRRFRPGEVYARKIEVRLTFNRPTAAYNIRMSRLIIQALLPPTFAPADVDGGSFA